MAYKESIHNLTAEGLWTQRLRKQIIEEWKSDKFKDKEIWERYGMSENAFYDLIKRYSEENENGLKDKSKKPINPHHKLEIDDIEIIIKKAQNELERIKNLQSEFENDMKNSGRSLPTGKLDRLKESMNSAIHGVRRIANLHVHRPPAVKPVQNLRQF